MPINCSQLYSDSLLEETPKESYCNDTRTQPERGDSEFCEIILRVLQKLVLLHCSVCSYERIKITEKRP